MWKGHFWVVTPTTVLISNVTGKVSSQNMLGLVRINILLSKVSKLCNLKKMWLSLKYKQKKMHNIKFMKSVVCTKIYIRLVRMCFTLQKYSEVFVSKTEFGKRKISCPVQDSIPSSSSWLQNPGFNYELSDKTEKNFFREECTSCEIIFHCWVKDLNRDFRF